MHVRMSELVEKDYRVSIKTISVQCGFGGETLRRIIYLNMNGICAKLVPSALSDGRASW